MRLLPILGLFPAILCFAADPPRIPVGLDAYRQWEKWPQQRIGVRAYMRSTYDRRGGNEGADASHFLYQTSENFNATLDVEGKGILYFARYNHWHGSPWHYVVDGFDSAVQETSTTDPNHPSEESVFLPERAFPNPLTWTWSRTRGADLSWVPIGFQHSFQMGYSRTHYGTGYYIYHQFVDGIPLSRSIHGWTTNNVPDPEVLRMLSGTAGELLPAPASKESKRLRFVESGGTNNLLAKDHIVFHYMEGSPQEVRALEFSVSTEQAEDFGKARLRIFWDGRAAPSVDAPIALFFGAGTLYNREEREYLVKAFPVNIRFSPNEVQLSCYFPMPFFKSAQFELEGAEKDISNLRWHIRMTPFNCPANTSAYFHATFRDFPEPQPGRDLVLLDTRETEGGGDWTGHFIGNSWIFSERGDLGTLEGDPRFFFDDSLTPQAQGTGTEEWGGGGDYWGGLNMMLPFAGHPVGAGSAKQAKNAQDKIESAYRFLLGDLMPFGRNAVIRLEHGGENQSTEHYQAVTYWYGLPSSSLILTDELKIGESESESAHNYKSPDASEPYEISSRYEWGVDHLAGMEIYPAETDRGRRMKGYSEFTLRLEPANLGVMLRRKLDYQFPNQKAEVFVSDADSHAPKWQIAGTWYLAGGNTCVYSNPKAELGAAEHNVQTSNRRFRDDEFLIPQRLSKGRGAIRVRIVFKPVERALFPGQPVPPLAWTEFKYTAYCFVLPKYQVQ